MNFVKPECKVYLVDSDLTFFLVDCITELRFGCCHISNNFNFHQYSDSKDFLSINHFSIDNVKIFGSFNAVGIQVKIVPQ